MPVISHDSRCFSGLVWMFKLQPSKHRPVYGMLDHSPIHFRDSIWSHRTNAIITD